MSEYTLEQCKADMLQMWGWLADNPLAEKFDFICTLPDDEHMRFLDLRNYCPCCEYAGGDENDEPICTNCPIVWDGDERSSFQPCMRYGASFARWEEAGYEEDRKLSRKSAKAILKLAEAIEVVE